MTRVKSLLRELSYDLNTTQIKIGNETTLVKKLEVDKKGGLRVQFHNGIDKTIPVLGKFLNESSLTVLTKVVREAKKRGLIGGVFSFFRWMALMMALVAIASLIVIFVGGKWLWDSFFG